MTRDLDKVAVGPLELDIALARELGWSEARIAFMRQAIAVLSRGAGLTQAMEDGESCEACGASAPRFKREGEGPCFMCDGAGKRV